MRIASLSPAATEILFSLGLQKDIVCVDQFSNFPDEAKKIPHVRGHQEMKTEDLRKFSPELVLTGTVIQQKLAAELRSQGFGVVHQDPRTINEIYESIRQLGTILERPAQAENVVLKMQQGFNGVKKKSALLKQEPRVYIEEWHLPPMASGNWVPEVVRIAGGLSFPIRDGVLSREVSLEEIMRFDPDLIIISWCGAGNLADKEILMKREGWGNLRAVKDGHVRVIDDSLLNRPGPRLVEGAQRIYGWLFEMTHS
ncbi:MAG: cobalamin-binding protein [Candidatus Peribacteraceae bacterium]|nr:cobalamin-binding protein [Candidatus Peribacteraceae bacterium]